MAKGVCKKIEQVEENMSLPKDSLLMEQAEPVVMIEKERVPDGEGGFKTTYYEGAGFTAVIKAERSVEARIAEKQGVTSLYDVIVSEGVLLEYHDIFKRIRDGKIFRVTSDGDDVKTPKSASFHVSVVTAEEWSLPK